MVLDEKTRELIAVGASFTAHCEPCLTAHVKKAAAAGAGEAEIRAALEVARAVRAGAAVALDRFAARWSSDAAAPATGCGCGGGPASDGSRCG